MQSRKWESAPPVSSRLSRTLSCSTSRFLGSRHSPGGYIKCLPRLVFIFATEWAVRIPKGVWERHAAASCRRLRTRGDSASKLPRLIVDLPWRRSSSIQSRVPNERTMSQRRRAGARPPHVHASQAQLCRDRSGYRVAPTTTSMTGSCDKLRVHSSLHCDIPAVPRPRTLFVRSFRGFCTFSHVGRRSLVASQCNEMCGGGRRQVDEAPRCVLLTFSPFASYMLLCPASRPPFLLLLGQSDCPVLLSTIKENVYWAQLCRGAIQCKICLYRPPAGVVGHKTRCCPVRKVECRYQLHKDNPFFLYGTCLNVYCVHNQFCPRCHMIGHTAHTLKRTPMRWRVTSNWRSVPEARAAMPPLDSRDFVCTLMTEQCVRSLLKNIQDLAL